MNKASMWTALLSLVSLVVLIALGALVSGLYLVALQWLESSMDSCSRTYDFEEPTVTTYALEDFSATYTLHDFPHLRGLFETEPTNPGVTLPDQDANNEATTCVICMVSQRAEAFQPCSHMVTCHACAAKLERCPICRRAIDTKVNVVL
jgi:hypothetical protein